MMLYSLLLALAALLAPAAAQTEADVLNFALNLECLEAQYYSYAAYGTGLGASFSGLGPAAVGGAKANLTSTYDNDLVASIADQELAHVYFLREALGADAVACPEINIGSAFASAINTALGYQLNPPFSPYNSSIDFLIGSFMLEDLGVSAYHGAISLLKTAAYITGASGIAATEAYHAGVIRNELFENYYATYNSQLTVGNFTSGIATLFTKVSSVSMNDIAATLNGVVHAVLAPVDDNGIVYARTPTQVLDILYLGSAATPGGFFPKGVTGFFAPAGGK